MTLSGEVPGRIQHALARRGRCARRSTTAGARSRFDSWAVHAGGRSILDAVEKGLELPQGALCASRDVLARYGNMSSSTLMFVLAELIGRPDAGKGVAHRLRARPRRRGLPLRARRPHEPRSSSALRDDEQMDDPGLDPADLRPRCCTISRGSTPGRSAARPTLAFLARGDAAGMPAFRLLDVGFGHGDMLRRIARWARRRGIAADLIGVDLNPKSAVGRRAAATPIDWPIDYRTGDYRDVAGPFDFVVSQPRRPSYDRRRARRLPPLHGGRARRAAGWSTISTATPSPITAFRCSRGCIGAAPDRARGRPALDRPRLPPAPTGSAILADAGIDRAAPRIVRRFPFRLCVERLR